MQTLQALWRIITIIWGRGTFYGRCLVGFTFLWPAVLALVAAGVTVLTPLLGLLPVLAVLAYFLFSTSPLWIAVISTVQEGRLGLRALSTLLGVELAIGVYFSLVPIRSAPEWLPLLFLAAFAFLFLALGGYRGWVRSALIVLIVLLSLAFYWAGIFRAAGVARQRMGAGVEQCVKRGGGFFDCLSQQVLPAPERREGVLPVQVVLLDPDVWKGPFKVPDCAGATISPSHFVTVLSEYRRSRREVTITAGKPSVFDGPWYGDKFWLKGRGFVELRFIPGGGCPR